MDVGVGTHIPPRVVEHVGTAEMKTMAALLADPNPIHWDPAVTRALGMGDRVVNQGPINMSYVMNALVSWVGDEPSRLRAITLRFMANVFEGDRVEAGGTVTGVRDVNGERLADCDVWLDITDGSRALAGTAVVALPLDMAE
jgi:acyl dehydratase